MEKSNTSKIITAALIVVLAICLTWVTILHQSNSSLNELLAKQKIESEALRSEKLLGLKVIDKANDSINRLERQKAELDDLLKHKAEVLTTQTRENKNIKKALRFAKEQYDTESTFNKELRKKLSSQNVSFSALDSLRIILTDSLAVLRGENAILNRELRDAIFRSIDQPLISGIKRNKAKVTSKARAAKKLVANVEIPATLNELRFVVEGPNGNVVSENSNAISARKLEYNKSLTASTSDKTYSGVKSQNIEITYVPDERLKAGVYTLKIFNNDKYVGSMKVKLR